MSAFGPPDEVPHPDDLARFGLLRSGRVAGVFQRPSTTGSEVLVSWSDDNADTWSAPERLIALDASHSRWVFNELLIDQDGEFHLFFLIMGEQNTFGGGEGERPLAGELLSHRIDIGYARSYDGHHRWSALRVFWIGYTGALNSVIQTRTGRIVLPFSYLTSRHWGKRGEDAEAFTFVGQYDSTVLHSDDGGENWRQGNALRTPVPDIVSAYGAVEPVVVERADGLIWMLIRTQMGRFWESFSHDGAQWSAPRPTAILSSDSPAGIVRLANGRLVLFWNNCLRYPYAYGGRQVLHAAISDDHGATWRGYREVGRDPRAWDPPPPSGDYGTAYPFPVVVQDDQVLFVSGQGEGRVLHRRLHPEWLLATTHEADFTARPEEWSFFGTRGVDWAPHPEIQGRRVLRVRKPEGQWPAAAIWNFPAAAHGRLRLRLRPQHGTVGARLLLTDHFSAPCDLEDVFNAVFAVEVPFAIAEAGSWFDLELQWDLAAQRCRLWIDGKESPPIEGLRQSAGVCYLRLRPAVEVGQIDEHGFALESVSFSVG